MNEKYRGCWTALVTPFHPDNSVNWEEYERNVGFQVEEGLTGVLPMGTTGESPSVTHQEHAKIISSAVEYVGGRCAVLAGTGSNSTDEALFETGRAVEAGVDCCLLVDCYYNKPSSLELRNEYYGPILSEFPDMDFITYSIPGRTNTVLTPEDIAMIRSKHRNLVAVKEASGDFERMRRIRSILPKDFNILSGDDPNTYAMMTDKTIGAAGVISVISNITPGPIERYTRLILEGKADKAKAIDDALMPLFKVVMVSCTEEVCLQGGERCRVTYKFPNPVPIKTMMAGLGMITGSTKRPLGRLTRQGVAQVRDALRTVWAKDPKLLEPVAKYYDVDITKRLKDDNIWEKLSY
ncbi:MAG: 4-hydroxy-tetrahydrodipicolinate synthase [Candidatus Altiarchaeota archaeon]